jgi:hypothetical protein
VVVVVAVVVVVVVTLVKVTDAVLGRVVDHEMQLMTRALKIPPMQPPLKQTRLFVQILISLLDQMMTQPSLPPVHTQFQPLPMQVVITTLS